MLLRSACASLAGPHLFFFFFYVCCDDEYDTVDDLLSSCNQRLDRKPRFPGCNMASDDDNAFAKAMRNLYDAIEERDAAAARAAIENGADVNSRLYAGMDSSPLMEACLDRPNKVRETGE